MAEETPTYKDIMTAPVLYESAFDDDSTQGLVTLSDALNCTVVFNYNSFPTLQMTYPRDGVGANLLDYNLVIMTDISWKWTHQKFRISQIQREGDDYLINANHIAADLIYKPTRNDISIANATAMDVANQVINDLAGDDHEFFFQSDVSKVSNVSIPAGPAGNIFIDPDQEGDSPTSSIVGLFGGELEFDNRNILHSKQAGRSTGIVVSYGKNLETISDDTNLDSTYTAIYPIAKYAHQQPKATASNVNWSGWDSDYRSIGSVTYSAGGAIEIYDTPLEGHQVIRTVQNGEHLTLGTPVHNGDLIPNPKNPNSTLEVDTVNGDDWYPIQGGGWIDARWINFSKSGDYVVNNVSGHVTSGSDDVEEGAWSVRSNEYGYIKVTYEGKNGGIRVFYDPEIGDQHNPTGRVIGYGEVVNYDWVTTNSKGDTWYRIGSHEWVYGPHVQVVNQQINVKGEGYVKKGADRYKWDSNKKKLVQDTRNVLSNKSSASGTKYTKNKKGKKTTSKTSATKFKPKKVKTTVPSGKHSISRIIRQGDEEYVKTSGGWVKSSDIDYKRYGSTGITNYDDAVKNSDHFISKIEMYQDVDRKHDLNYSIPFGTPLDVTAQATSFDGVTMYEVTFNGRTGWIRSDLTNTNGDMDIEPASPDDTYSSDDDSGYGVAAEVEDVLVEIGTLYSAETFAEENARIERVDLSQYFQHDDTDMSGLQPDGQFAATEADKEQLRKLAEAYMIEHDFGHPKTSLTVSYQQLTGLAGDQTQLDLYDYVTVEYPKLGIHVPAEVTSTTWDCLAHRYTQVTIGDLPKSWQHELMQATEKQTSSAIASSARSTQGWLNRFEDMMKSEGSDRIAKENKMMEELGMVREYTVTNAKGIEEQKKAFLVSREKFENQFSEIRDTADSIHNWIQSGGSGMITAYPNWQNPTYLSARTGNGGEMRFSGNGLEFYDPSSNKLNAGISSEGKLYADSIDGVSVNTMYITSCIINSALTIGTPDGSMKVYIGTGNPGSYLNPDHGGNVIWLISDNYQSMLSSGQLSVSNNQQITTIRPSGITSPSLSVNGLSVDSTGIFWKGTTLMTKDDVKSAIKKIVRDTLTIGGKTYDLLTGYDNY